MDGDLDRWRRPARADEWDSPHAHAAPSSYFKSSIFRSPQLRNAPLLTDEDDNDEDGETHEGNDPTGAFPRVDRPTRQQRTRPSWLRQKRVYDRSTVSTIRESGEQTPMQPDHPLSRTIVPGEFLDAEAMSTGSEGSRSAGYTPHGSDGEDHHDGPYESGNAGTNSVDGGDARENDAYEYDDANDDDEVDRNMAASQTHAFARRTPTEHNGLWGTAYRFSIAAMLSTSMMVYLNTSPPDRRHPIGDTIYNVIHRSYGLLAAATAVATIVSVGWLSVLQMSGPDGRAWHVRRFFNALVLAVPASLLLLSGYGFFWSFFSARPEQELQSTVLRWLSVIPFLTAIGWILVAVWTRHLLASAILMLELTIRLVDQFPLLIIFSLGTLAVSIAWTWIWLAMFARIFLGGHYSLTEGLFQVDKSSWVIGAFFIVMYGWTNNVLTGLQRVTAAGTISSWFFHPAKNQTLARRRTVVDAFQNGLLTQFGPVAKSGFVATAVRLPLLFLPGRIGRAFVTVVSMIMPANVALLTSPLALTTAAVLSRSLDGGASELAGLQAEIPTVVAVEAEGGRTRVSGPISPYRLAKMLLRGSRYVMCVAIGMIGWVSASQRMAGDGTSGPAVPFVRGSLYAYVVGLVAGTIGWCVFGAVEGVVGSVLDAMLICWARERSSAAAQDSRASRNGRTQSPVEMAYYQLRDEIDDLFRAEALAPRQLMDDLEGRPSSPARRDRQYGLVTPSVHGSERYSGDEASEQAYSDDAASTNSIPHPWGNERGQGGRYQRAYRPYGQMSTSGLMMPMVNQSGMLGRLGDRDGESSQYRNYHADDGGFGFQSARSGDATE